MTGETPFVEGQVHESTHNGYIYRWQAPPTRFEWIEPDAPKPAKRKKAKKPRRFVYQKPFGQFPQR